jgi:hypothetical protein
MRYVGWLPLLFFLMITHSGELPAQETPSTGNVIVLAVGFE